MLDTPTNDDILEEGLEHFLRNKETEVLINNNLNITLKEHLKSFAITFSVAFASFLVLEIDQISISTFTSGAIYGVAFGALRAGVKGVLNLLIVKFS